jgi:flagellar biosynthetic protein FliR
MDGFEDKIFGLFLQFCRIGGCLLFAPGFSSPRVPMQIRLFAAMALTAALAPLLQEQLTTALSSASSSQKVYMIISETLIGAAIGLMARFFFLALQFAATAISNFIGLAGIPGIPLEEGDTGSPLATLVSSAAVMLVFTMGLHIELLIAVMDSYRVLQPGAPLPFSALTSNMVDVASETSLLALRLAAPFLVYGVIVNFALGIGNRFAQHLSVYHATTGVVILGGLLLLYTMWIDWILIFTGSYQAWLVRGGL